MWSNRRAYLLSPGACAPCPEQVRLPWWLRGKESACHCRRCSFHPWAGKIPWRRKWQPPPVFLPGESHGQRSLGRLQSMRSQKSVSQFNHSVMSDSLRPHGLQPARFLCPRAFSRQEYWRGLPCPSPGNLPNLSIKPRSPTLQVDSLLTKPQGKPTWC